METVPSKAGKRRAGTNSDCSGYDWTVGEVYGFKAFDRDALGRLVSPSAPHLWTPGENVSNFAENNTHGFYAYKSGPMWRGEVHGIIKGYGRTTEGTRGFQCEKAEIVALVEKEPVKRTRLRNLTAKFLYNDRVYDLSGVAFIGAAASLLFVASVFITVGLMSLSPWLLLLCVIPPVVFGVVRRHIKIFSSSTGRGRSWSLAKDYLGGDSVPSLRTLYPNVKFYTSFDELKGDGRVQPSRGLTPDDPEFWTVEV